MIWDQDQNEDSSRYEAPPESPCDPEEKDWGRDEESDFQD